MKLIAKLIAGIIIGILMGSFAPEAVVRLAFTFKELIGQFILFVVPLIILFFVTSGIASLRNKSGSSLAAAVGLSYGFTILAGILACLLGLFLIPGIVDASLQTVQQGRELSSFFMLTIPPPMDIMTALALAFVLGLGIASTDSDVLERGFDQGANILELLLNYVIIPLLPFYIAGVFAEVAAEGKVLPILKTFGVVLALAICTHWLWLVLLYTLTGALTGRNPLKALRQMLPAYFTALGTMSSVATIPVTLRQTEANGVSVGVANFTVPLCATIYLAGSTITITTCTIAVMFISPSLDFPGFSVMLPFVFMLGIVMVAAPGVPGGAVMAALGLLGSMLGFDSTALALMIALYLAQDSFGTACNVTGAGAIALLIDKFVHGEGKALTP